MKYIQSHYSNAVLAADLTIKKINKNEFRTIKTTRKRTNRLTY